MKPVQEFNYVLVVEDDVNLRMVTTFCIQKAGVKAIGVANGLEALKLLIDNTKDKVGLPSLIITDISMPIMNGWELLTCISMMKEEYNTIPIVVVTSEPATSNERYEVLRKPFELIQLQDIITKYVPKVPG